MTCSHCEDLKAEIAFLKSELGDANAKHERVKLRTGLGLDPAETAILTALYGAKGRLLDQYRLEEVLPHQNEDRSPNLIKVYISRIRAKLGKDTIHTVYSEGYGLTPAGLSRVLAVLHPASEVAA